jgi:malate dehydrogenase
MVPLPRYSTVAGIPITELIEKTTRSTHRPAHPRRRRRDREVSQDRLAYYAPGGRGEMVEAILKDKKKILPCAAYLQGEYGIKGLYVGVPCKLGAKGLEQIIQIKLCGVIGV